MIKPRRSLLYMPASNARALDKAASLDCDVVILDLEDAVAPEAKDSARAQAGNAIAGGALPPREVVLRVNSLGTPWGNADIAMLGSLAAPPDAVLIPKVQSPDGIAAAREKLGAAGVPPKVAIWAMIETPHGVLNAAAIAAANTEGAAHPLAAFVMGTNDLAKETRAGLGDGRPGMQAWLSHCVVAARAFGVAIVDGVYNTLDDDAGLEAECLAGRALGMDGKTLIHPRQIAAANRIFGPGASEIAEARAILEAFALPENTGKGAIALGGRMVERLHADVARDLIALADAVAARSAR